MVCHVVCISYSGLHVLMDILTNGRCVGGDMNRESLFWEPLKCFVMIVVKCFVCRVW
jgi:hypothetical protein